MTLKEKLHTTIFESETRAGKIFNIALIILILISVSAVIIESIPSVHEKYGQIFLYLELFFTGIFTIEYCLRLYSVKKPLSYAFSFFGVVDFFSIIPTFLVIVLPGAQSLLILRSIRLLRVFRIFKLGIYFDEGSSILNALIKSRYKISVFFFSIIILVTISGGLMYMVESPESGFTDIPTSIYWAIVTMTTVGYGDIAPATALGKGLASLLMISGYAIIAVPTGIVTAELTKTHVITNNACPTCGREGHAADAVFCKFCGSKL
ncbi:ion transporter [Bacteriovorax sp. PP10]|uniref:Ion transporter n=1 Tax=Bacteriovorax antarcticus TaxID=3088717 RepID=A0ABU5VWC7_9BACT|nr:ion transporter [Bacteriovorax sp. PP10]MEA9357373.1 ion transporter [Bacteriovorax sp. PP10]